MRIKPHKFKGIYVLQKGKRQVCLTPSFVPGRVYGEDLHRDGKIEYREWSPTRSKIGAALAKNISQLGIYPGSKVLYLGASTGTTASHVSDVVGKDGFVFALDFAPRTTRELVYLCDRRNNMSPILGDARHPKQYAHYITTVDTVFQDIAQRDQAEIFIRNCDAFLKKGGFGILTVKARSVDVSKKPKQVFKNVRDYIEDKITIVDYRELDPFEKDHCIFICKRK
ncbi:fibrillarin-like rRNA/tRNA 2'-O-methyltransferase [Candidatus Woesearchaeota archaeon]|nr:fibrillarin-like rRNA/tRNA 2'-O-methyltransferase [Candidatus Woesearchaeota archaeon]